MKEKRTSQNAKFGEATKVVRLPETLATFLKQYPSVVGELVTQIKDGEINLSIPVTALQAVRDNDAYDFDRKITDAIAPLVARLEALENSRSEATATANFTKALLQKAKEVAPLKLKEAA